MDILKHACRTAQVTPAKACLFSEEGQAELRGDQRALQHPTCKPISVVKLKVLPLIRAKEFGMEPGVKILTSVR